MDKKRELEKRERTYLAAARLAGVTGDAGPSDYIFMRDRTENCDCRTAYSLGLATIAVFRVRCLATGESVFPSIFSGPRFRGKARMEPGARSSTWLMSVSKIKVGGDHVLLP